jgi:hypothetical protein
LIEENQTFQVEIHVPNKLPTSVVTYVKNYYFSFIKAHETITMFQLNATILLKEQIHHEIN